MDANIRNEQKCFLRILGERSDHRIAEDRARRKVSRRSGNNFWTGHMNTPGRTISNPIPIFAGRFGIYFDGRREMYFGVGENAGTSTCTCFYLHLSQTHLFSNSKVGKAATIPTSKKSLISMANRFMTWMPKYAHLNRRNRQLQMPLLARPRGQNGRASTS